MLVHDGCRNAAEPLVDDAKGLHPDALKDLGHDWILDGDLRQDKPLISLSPLIKVNFETCVIDKLLCAVTLSILFQSAGSLDDSLLLSSWSTSSLVMILHSARTPLWSKKPFILNFF